VRRVWVVLWFVGVARAEPVPAIDERVQMTLPRPEVVRFDNKLELWMVPRPGLPLVSVVVAVRQAGSANDPPHKLGMAAFTVDLLDEGRRPGQTVDLVEEIERDGGTLRAWVDEDAAMLAVGTLARALPHTLDVLHTMVTAPPFTDADAVRVRDAHLDQIRLRPDRPNAVASVILGEALFGARSPYGHPPLGFLATVEKLSMGDARLFRSERFRPSSTVLVVVGDFVPAELRALVDARFGGWNAEIATPARPAVAPPAPGTLSVVDVPGATQANLLLGTRGVSRDDETSFDVDVLTTMLGGTFGSLLNRRLREELGLTYGADAYATFLRHDGRVVIATDVATPKTVRALRETLAIAKRLADRPPPPKPLQQARLALVHSLPRAFDTHVRTAETVAAMALHRLPADWLYSYRARIEAVTPARVQAAAKKLFGAGRVSAVVVGDVGVIGPGLGKLGLGPPVRFTADAERAP
jgi:zinc protease